MTRRVHYDTQATWDDPTERVVERRRAPRIATHQHVKLAVRLPDRPQPWVGPGIADNLSIAGMYCRSKHMLSVGQAVEVYISFRDCPRAMGLPRAMLGIGHVAWLKPDGDKVLGAGIRFGEDVADDFNLALFVDHLASVEKSKTPLPVSIRTPFPGAELPRDPRS